MFYLLKWGFSIAMFVYQRVWIWISVYGMGDNMKYPLVNKYDY
jgi:hypothetical protein